MNLLALGAAVLTNAIITLLAIQRMRSERHAWWGWVLWVLFFLALAAVNSVALYGCLDGNPGACPDS